MTHLEIVATIAVLLLILGALFAGWLWLCDQPASHIDTTREWR